MTLCGEQTKTRRTTRKKAATTDSSHGHGSTKEEDKKQEAFDLVLSTIDALVSERGAEDKIWGSMVKQALKTPTPRIQRGPTTASSPSTSCWRKPPSAAC